MNEQIRTIIREIEITKKEPNGWLLELKKYNTRNTKSLDELTAEWKWQKVFNELEDRIEIFNLKNIELKYWRKRNHIFGQNECPIGEE